jgi:glycosyltransferase involved in cell wall biosynthesis
MRGSVIVAHPGAQHSRETALALQDAGMLKAYVTGIYYKSHTGLGRVLGISSRIERQMRRRYKAGLAPELIQLRPWEELLYLTAVRVRPLTAYAGPIIRWRNRRFDRHIARLVKRERPPAVICYDGCAVDTFRAAEAVGTLRILDQSVGHWRTLAALMREEAALHPEFADSLPDLPEDFLAACTAEGLDADHVLAGSQYVKDTMVQNGVEPWKVTVVPYGADIDTFVPKPAAEDGIFRILFVGQLSQRKGIKYLLEAVSQLNLPAFHLTLVGGVVGSGEGMIRYRNYFRHVDSVPHHEVHRYFQQADIFVYPSLHEGSAIAIYEALASGLPVITTPNSGSMVRDGVEGFIVSIRDVEALKEKILLLFEDRELRDAMGTNARKRAEEFTWAAYRRKAGSLLHKLLSCSAGDVKADS